MVLSLGCTLYMDLVVAFVRGRIAPTIGRARWPGYMRGERGMLAACQFRCYRICQASAGDYTWLALNPTFIYGVIDGPLCSSQLRAYWEYVFVHGMQVRALSWTALVRIMVSSWA